MANGYELKADGEPISPIFIHLQMDQHCLSLQEFIKLANSTSAISKDISFHLLSDGAAVEILVFPPEEGSFKLKLALTVSIGASVVSVGWSFLKGLS
jgi:hypothetical protein